MFSPSLACTGASCTIQTFTHAGQSFCGFRYLRVAAPASVALLLLSLSGCGRQESIEHYRVPSRAALWAENHSDQDADKEAAVPGQAAADRLRMPGTSSPPADTASGLTYDTPAAWTVAPGDQFSTAAFEVVKVTPRPASPSRNSRATAVDCWRTSTAGDAKRTCPRWRMRSWAGKRNH